MIERYSLSPMKELWSEYAKYERWLEVELALVKAFEYFKEAPKGTESKIRSQVHIDVQDILTVEKTVDHDVIAFIKSITRNMGDEARYIHKGLTSSDVVDTANALAMKESLDMIMQELINYKRSLLNLAQRHKYTVTVGRTHGVHAEPTTFGLKILSFVAEVERNVERLRHTILNVSFGKMSGAVGNYANLRPEIEEIALGFLGLKPIKVATQIIPRDIYAEFLATLAFIGTSIERFATEVRHLQRTEVLEVQEPFKKGQRGSSAMPHKKNPILCERLCGMARMLRSYTIAGFEDIVLWHERDISHSSVERVFIPDSSILAHYMLIKARYLVNNMVVYSDNMLKNMHSSYNLIYSQRVLLKLVEKKIDRETAYKLVQKNALKSWESKKDFKEILKSDEDVIKIFSEDELDSLFSNDYYLKNIDKIFDRFK